MKRYTTASSKLARVQGSKILIASASQRARAILALVDEAQQNGKKLIHNSSAPCILQKNVPTCSNLMCWCTFGRGIFEFSRLRLIAIPFAAPQTFWVCIVHTDRSLYVLRNTPFKKPQRISSFEISYFSSFSNRQPLCGRKFGYTGIFGPVLTSIDVQYYSPRNKAASAAYPPR